jgi:SHS2 domain-containing protein
MQNDMIPFGWEHLPRGADIGVGGFGRSKEEAFALAAIALTAVIIDPHQFAPESPIEVDCAESGSPNCC